MSPASKLTSITPHNTTLHYTTGKFTRLQFDDNYMLAGSQCVTYLLEKVRFLLRQFKISLLFLFIPNTNIYNFCMYVMG